MERSSKIFRKKHLRRHLISPRRRGVVVNVNETRYPVIQKVCIELGWKIEVDEEWDLLWADGNIPKAIFSRMKVW